MGRRRNKKKTTANDAFGPAPSQTSPDVKPQEQPALVETESANNVPPGSQYWSDNTDNVGASTDVNQRVYPNLGTAHYSVASPDDIAVPPEHVNPMGMPPPGFKPQMQPVFMPSYGYPVMQDFSGYQPMSGAVFGDASYQTCPFMNVGSQAMGSQDFQASHSNDNAFGEGALYGTPMGAESGASSMNESAIGTQQGNVVGVVNEAMMEDPAIIVAQEGHSPKSSVPALNEEINKIKELASQAIDECQELQQMAAEEDPNDCWADQVEEEMVELELQMEAKKLQERCQAEKAEAAYVEQSNLNKNGKPSTVASAATKTSVEGPTESKEVVKEMQQEAEKLQAKASAERAETAFVQYVSEKNANNSAVTADENVEINVTQELAAESKKLQEKIAEPAEVAEVAVMEAMNMKSAQEDPETNYSTINNAVVLEMQSEGKKAQDRAAAEKAEAEFVAKFCDAGNESKKSTEEVDTVSLEDLKDLGHKVEALNTATAAQAEYHALSGPAIANLKSDQDSEGERHINEALKAEGERSQILMNAVHCEATYYERQFQQPDIKSQEQTSTSNTNEQENKAERKSSPTEKKVSSWASIVADTSKEIIDRSSPDVEPAKEKEVPKELGVEKTSPRISPDKVTQKKEMSPPKKLEAETPTDAAPASVSPFADEEGFVEPRKARRNRRRKTSRKSESECTDDEKTAETPDEAAPACPSSDDQTSPSSDTATARDENGNQLTGHRMNIIETDEVSTQTDGKKAVVTSNIESQTELPANKVPSKEDKAKDAMEAELMQEKSQRMAGEGIIKVLEAETEQYRKQLAFLQQQHVLMENDYVIAKGDLTEEKRLAKEYKSRCSELERELDSKRNEVVTMQTQLQQREAWIGGTDYMLDLKEAKMKVMEADAAISAMQNQLKQSQNEVQKLQDQLCLAQEKQSEMIPMDRHIALLQKAEEKAMESEMKILQLQTEVLALQNSQQLSNVQVEKQGQLSASVAAKPSAQKTTREKAVEVPAQVNPETSEESDQSSMADSEGLAPAASVVTGASLPKPQATGSKKEVKNATNNSKGGNKGKSRERPSLPPKPNNKPKPSPKPRPAVPPKPVRQHPIPLDNKHSEHLAHIEHPTCFDKEVEAPSLSVLHKPRGPPNRRKPSKFQK